MTTTYCTSDELSRRLASDGVAISADYDDELTDAITVASRAIDAYTNRRFYADTTTSAREFDYSRIHKDRQGRQVLDVDDLQAASITEVVADDGDTGTYGTTWSTSDYYTYPLNGLNERGEAWPVTRLVGVGTKTMRTYGYRPSMKLTAKWGWVSVPAAVKTACLIVAADLYKQREAPFGLAGSDEFGTVRVSRDVLNRATSLLAPYRRDNLFPIVGV